MQLWIIISQNSVVDVRERSTNTMISIRWLMKTRKIVDCLEINLRRRADSI